MLCVPVLHCINTTVGLARWLSGCRHVPHTLVNNVSLVSRTHRMWKERTNLSKLSSNFHMHTVACAHEYCVYTHTIINEYHYVSSLSTGRKPQDA